MRRWIPTWARTSLALLRSEDTDQPAGQISGRAGITFIRDNVQTTYEDLLTRGVRFTAPPERMRGIVAA